MDRVTDEETKTFAMPYFPAGISGFNFHASKNVKFLSSNFLSPSKLIEAIYWNHAFLKIHASIWVIGLIIGIYNVESLSYCVLLFVLFVFRLQTGAFQIDFLEFEFSINTVFYIHSWAYYLIRKKCFFKEWFILLWHALFSDVDSSWPRARRKRKALDRCI